LYYDPPPRRGVPGALSNCGAAEWREGYPLVYDQRERQYRGSLVNLKPDTPYEIRLEAGGEQADLKAER